MEIWKKMSETPRLLDRWDTSTIDLILKETIAVSFYNVNHGSSIIFIESLSNNHSNENKKTGVSRGIIFEKWFILAF